MSRKSLLAQGTFIPEGELPEGELCKVFVGEDGSPAVLVRCDDAAATLSLACVAAIVAKRIGVERAEEVVRAALRGD